MSHPCSEFAHERIVGVAHLLLGGVIAQFLSPGSFEELSKAWRSKLVQVSGLHGPHELFDSAYEGVVAGRRESGSAFSRQF